jgi:glutamate racemase
VSAPPGSAVPAQPAAARPIGVFDSGVGGLTVLRALRERLPAESYCYLGDTARLPYGTKSAHTVERYALQAADALVARGIKLLVVACNTASAAALPAMRARYGELPVVGVIEPGARAACEASTGGRIAVLATESTVRGGAYQRAIRELRPDAQVTALACGLFVALAEEGWADGPIALQVAERYLAGLGLRQARAGGDTGSGAGAAAIDTLVLGCTHFPALAATIARAAGAAVRIVDSAATTATAVAAELATRGLAGSGHGTLRLLATDGPERFASVGGRFLGAPLAARDVELVDL